MMELLGILPGISFLRSRAPIEMKSQHFPDLQLRYRPPVVSARKLAGENLVWVRDSRSKNQHVVDRNRSAWGDKKRTHIYWSLSVILARPNTHQLYK